jgi:hypothetical protein
MRTIARRGTTTAGVLLAVGALGGAIGLPAGAATAQTGAPAGEGATTASAVVPAAGAGSSAAGSCRLGNGVKHVINITFDNVHFFRDNPNVPSDLEQMPTLYRFLRNNGVVLSNMHTPLIAHTAEDSLAIYSGLYGDRHGQPVSNTYHTYTPEGATEPDTSFVYWTSPVITTSTRPPSASTNDTNPSMVYSPTVPARNTPPGQIAPEPWVAYTKAGCSFGAFSSANLVLENAGDIPTAFGSAQDPAPYANVQSAFIGEAIHCGLGDAKCEQAQGAVKDTPPPANKPGSATYKALFGHKYVAPVLAANAHAPSPYRVTDNAGNLVDLDNREIADFQGNVGVPGFNPTAPQSLAMIAAMQEAGIPVTYGYISDIHERKDWSYGCTTTSATATGNAVGPGDACYVDNARRYDQAFAKFLDRLAKDGITPRNTVFVIGAEENDHFAGANVGRAQHPTDPADCDGVRTPCRYDPTQIGEVQANLPGLLQAERGNTTPFLVEPQGAAMYVTNQNHQAVSPPPDDPAVRQLERDTAALTADNPHSGVQGEKVVNYQAGATEQRILHLETADPQRTPTYTVFPKPDYYFDNAAPPCATSATPQSACVTVNSRFAWNHGYYSPDIDITWSSFVGPGVRRLGVDGPRPANSPQVKDPDGGGLVPAYSRVGTWADETDIRPTMLHLTGLADDYVMDGRVLTQILQRRDLRPLQELGGCYKQLNASVGRFGTDTLLASTRALASGSAGDDTAYARTDAALSALGSARDALAQKIKVDLDRAEFRGAHLGGRTVGAELLACNALLNSAARLAG